MKTRYECPYCKKQLQEMKDLGHERPYAYVCNTLGCPGQKEAWVDDGTGKIVPKDKKS